MQTLDAVSGVTWRRRDGEKNRETGRVSVWYYRTIQWLRINASKGSHSLFKFSFPQPVRLTMSHYQSLSRPAVSSTGTTPHPVAINSSLTLTSCGQSNEVSCAGGGGSCDGVREVHGGPTCVGGGGSWDGVREVHGGAMLCAGGGGNCDGVREVHGGATAPDTPQRASQTNPGQYLGHLTGHSDHVCPER